MPPETTAEQDAREALAKHPFPQTPWVKVADEGIVIAAGYSEALNRLLRWMPKAKWRADRRSWLIPFSSAEALRAVFPEITRLADAAQELDEPDTRLREARPQAEPVAAGEPAGHLQDRLREAMELLHGEDWRAALAKEFPNPAVSEAIAKKRALDPADPIFAELAARLRRNAEALNLAAERLEESLRPAHDGA
ncbi:hypothetical protein RZS28_14430 [Methylocapsa polymorpha]|uniref:Uncharacterized protein n=1 Tax=Methylocapsa polymorpha TaxID=3080828 RepID=A0ABZ0HNW9_9HYPH|nr:hypothetical protein RZS28_14430 [Methylocapsa sp. RX1]